MAMQKAYSRINWVNYPNMDTPLNEANLNKIDVATNEIDERVLTLDTTKFDKTEAQKLVKSITFNSKNGVFTIEYYSGKKDTIDTKLEKLAVNFGYDEETQRIYIILDDGSIQYIDISALIQKDEFVNTETIAFNVDDKGKVSAVVQEGSINEKHLRPDYLAEIKVESAKAVEAKESAELSAYNSEQSANASSASASESANSAKAAAGSASSASASANTATEQAASASDSADAAKASEGKAAQSASDAEMSATTATRQAASANNSASTAIENAQTATNKAKEAEEAATKAQSWAVGGTDTRENEDTDNAKHYYEQAKHLIQGVTGIVNMGTVKFENLPADPEVNHMYNISDAFTSDDRFQDGSGIHYAAGNNVVWTGDEKWDVLAASSVTGVKGEAEQDYHQGNVNITKASLGLGNVDNTKDINKNVNSAKTADKLKNALTFAGNISETFDGSAPKTVQVQSPTGNTGNNIVNFTSGDNLNPSNWTNVELIKTGENHSNLFNKISTMCKNVRWLFSRLGNTDISKIGDGTVTGAISALNSSGTQEYTYVDNMYAKINNVIMVCTQIQLTKNFSVNDFLVGGYPVPLFPTVIHIITSSSNVYSAYMNRNGQIVLKTAINMIESAAYITGYYLAVM